LGFLHGRTCRKAPDLGNVEKTKPDNCWLSLLQINPLIETYGKKQGKPWVLSSQDLDDFPWLPWPGKTSNRRELRRISCDITWKNRPMGNDGK